MVDKLFYPYNSAEFVRNFWKIYFVQFNVFMFDITVNFLNIRTPKHFVKITLKFELCGSTIE